MIYLIASIFLSAGVSSALKIAGIKKLDSDNVTLYNYIFAVSFSLINCLKNNHLHLIGNLPKADVITLLSVRNPGNSALLTLLFGIVLGLAYLGIVVSMKHSIQNNGVGITSFFSKTGFILTTIFSIIVWREIPGLLQWVGIAAAIMALLLMLSNTGEKGNIHAPQFLLMVVSCNAIIEINKKCFTMYAINDFQDVLVLIIFTVALFACIFYNFGRKRKAGIKFKIKNQEILLGIFMGLPNVLSSIVQLLGLQNLPATVFFPSSAAGSLVFSILLGRFAFKETLSKKQIMAVVVAMISLVLINI